MPDVAMFKELLPGDMVFAKDQVWFVVSRTNVRHNRVKVVFWTHRTLWGTSVEVLYVRDLRLADYYAFDNGFEVLR